MEICVIGRRPSPIASEIAACVAEVEDDSALPKDFFSGVEALDSTAVEVLLSAELLVFLVM